MHVANNFIFIPCLQSNILFFEKLISYSMMLMLQRSDVRILKHWL